MSDNNGTPPTTDSNDGFNVMRVVYIALGVLVGLFVLVLVLAVAAALADIEAFGPAIEVVRDIVLIFLALQGILIILALVVLIAQVARLVNLLQNEVAPVLNNTQETVQHARGTVEFVGKNLSEPVIKANAFFAGASVFVRESLRLRAAIQQDGDRSDHTDVG